jgi:hypothetical protein
MPLKKIIRLEVYIWADPDVDPVPMQRELMEMTGHPFAAKFGPESRVKFTTVSYEQHELPAL